MYCPSCKNLEAEKMDVRLKPAGLTEEIMECRVCGTMWAVSHGAVELLRDPQAGSFLATRSEPVESDDYDSART